MNARLATRQFLRGRHALMGFIRLLVRDSHAAEDIFQDVWMELIDATERRKEIDDLPKWCRGVARNLAKRHWREQKHGRIVAGTELLDQIELAFAEAQQADDYWDARHNALKDCVSLLPERAQQLLRQRCEAGNTLAAMASELNRTVEAVTKSLSRIRATLRRCVERKLKVELQP